MHLFICVFGVLPHSFFVFVNPKKSLTKINKEEIFATKYSIFRREAFSETILAVDCLSGIFSFSSWSPNSWFAPNWDNLSSYFLILWNYFSSRLLLVNFFT